ncbi:MAG: hypothetical protein A2096_00615 [Spirochaetes bacterium GWF1_41_5]|nr:MAG: hypothetical protein A2096_00615 [Spirochaetes bacterium GWF1_41_5]
MIAIVFNIGKYILSLKNFLKEKGNRHFTIMMIPHSEKKIFTFQISNFIIFFLFLIITFSVYSIVLYSIQSRKISSEINTITKTLNEYLSKKEIYDDVLSANFLVFSEYQNELKKIFSSINLQDNKKLWKSTFDNSEIYRYLNNKYSIHNTFLPENIYKIYSIKQKISDTQKHLDEIRLIMEARHELFDFIPSKWPIHGGQGYKTSDFGVRLSPFLGKTSFHTGVDIAWFPRTPIIAAARGYVAEISYKSGYGNTVLITHKYGYQTLYAHNAQILVQAGNSIEKGDIIALLGKTGRTTGPHLHFEIRVQGKPVDPWPYINTKF